MSEEKTALTNVEMTLMDLLQEFTGCNPPVYVDPALAVEFAKYYDPESDNEMPVASSWPEFIAGFRSLPSPTGQEEFDFYQAGLKVREEREKAGLVEN